MCLIYTDECAVTGQNLAFIIPQNKPLKELHMQKKNSVHVFKFSVYIFVKCDMCISDYILFTHSCLFVPLPVAVLRSIL